MSGTPTFTPGETGNRLLDRLPPAEAETLLASAERVELRRSQEIHELGAPIRDVYFPTSGVLSVIVRLEQGRQVEAATIGNEGMSGLTAVLAVEFNPTPVIAQVPGEAYRIAVGAFRTAMETGENLDRLLRRYAAFRLSYASQTIACNAVHVVEERMCRWLLMAHDRAGRDVFSLTHEFLAEMLGVRRQSVTVTAGILHRAGLIAYRRGQVHVTDRRGLEEASCECYEVSRSLYDRLVG